VKELIDTKFARNMIEVTVEELRNLKDYSRTMRKKEIICTSTNKRLIKEVYTKLLENILRSAIFQEVTWKKILKDYRRTMRKSCFILYQYK